MGRSDILSVLRITMGKALSHTQLEQVRLGPMHAQQYSKTLVQCAPVPQATQG